MNTKFDNPNLANEFMEFAVLVKHNYDHLLTNGCVDSAEILDSAWQDVCMAGESKSRKIIGFRNPGAMSLMMLQDARNYLTSHADEVCDSIDNADEVCNSIDSINIDTVRRCAIHLNHLTEPQVMREYISAFTIKHLDPWSIHVDAAYVYCKLRVSGTISHLLTDDVADFVNASSCDSSHTSEDHAAVDKCRAIDTWVLARIQPEYAKHYIRLADNRTTFATAKHFCKYAIDTKRNSQEYLCGLVNLVDQVMAMPAKCATVPADTQLPAPASSDHDSECELTVERMENVLDDRYVKTEIIRIARALRLNPKRHKRDIIKEIVKILAHKSCDLKYINARVAAWRRAGRISRKRVA